MLRMLLGFLLGRSFLGGGSRCFAVAVAAVDTSAAGVRQLGDEWPVDIEHGAVGLGFHARQLLAASPSFFRCVGAALLLLFGCCRRLRFVFWHGR